VKQTDVAIVGAGPYGLSIAAHLAAAGVDFRIFGTPMQFWWDISKAGAHRYLKSFCFGTSLSSPYPGLGFVDYNKERGLETFEPCSMQNFAEYGSWFQHQQVPNLEVINVIRITRQSTGFLVLLESGERVLAREVTIATGLSHFANIPSVLHSLPRESLLHTSEIKSYHALRGRHVAIVGRGQSALEAAALLVEAGAFPELFVRTKRIRWLNRTSQKPNLWQKFRSPLTDLGPGPKAWLLTNFPWATYYMPEVWRTAFVKRHLPAAGAWWLHPRLEGKLPIHTGTSVIGARQNDGKVTLRFQAKGDQQLDRQFDNVIAGTGYSVNIDRLPFLDPALSQCIEKIETSPRLNRSFECSVPGLRFVGPLSAMSFGPMFRFVVGVNRTAKTICEQVILGNRPSRNTI
jgi:cation diffusion facilitator CzcD-associated flavoprotein CzcO